MRSEQNPDSGELAATARALSSLVELRFRSIALLTSNKSAVFTLRQPRQQSEQEHVRHIYASIRALRRNGNVVIILWLPSSEENELLKLAKEKAREATPQGATPQTDFQNAIDNPQLGTI
jgi:ribonuclease HI